jgi:low affinity Fe/Cu permease
MRIYFLIVILVLIVLDALIFNLSGFTFWFYIVTSIVILNILAVLLLSGINNIHNEIDDLENE